MKTAIGAARAKNARDDMTKSKLTSSGAVAGDRPRVCVFAPAPLLTVTIEAKPDESHRPTRSICMPVVRASGSAA